MADHIYDIAKRIANPFIFGNIIISLCTLSLFLETYLLLELPVQLDGLALLVFFATLFIYNFHRLVGVRRIKEEERGIITGWAAKHQFTLFMLALIGVGGVGFFVFQVPVTIVIILIVLGGIALMYELPVVRYNRKFQTLRNLWVHKIFMITTVWAIATALLPAINSGVPLNDYRLWLIVAGRMIFIFLLALCFDARDVEFDKKENVSTIPIRFGMKRTEYFYKLAAGGFLLLSVIHYGLLRHQWGIMIAAIISIALTWWVVSQTNPRRSDYYYMFIVDGMMVVQFMLVWGFSAILSGGV